MRLMRRRQVQPLSMTSAVSLCCRVTLNKCFDRLKFMWIPKLGGVQLEFVTHKVVESAELAWLYQNARLYAILSTSWEFLFARFAFSIFPLTLNFLPRILEKELLLLAGEKTLLSRTASAVQRRN